MRTSGGGPGDELEEDGNGNLIGPCNIEQDRSWQDRIWTPSTVSVSGNVATSTNSGRDPTVGYYSGNRIVLQLFYTRQAILL